MKAGIYCDSSINGGHEEMLKRYMLALVESPDVQILYVMVPSDNSALFRYVTELSQAHAKVQTIALSYTAESIRGDPVALWRMTRSTAATLRTLSLDKLLIAQGTIVSGLAGLFAARLSHTRTVSYLPLIDEKPEGGGAVEKMKWLVKRGVYRMPHEYVTLNEHLRARLRTLAPRAHTSILVNYADDRFARSTLTRSSARAMLGLPDDGTTILAQIGRIDFKQKRQDFLLDAIERHAERFARTIVLIIGDGPDTEKLQSMVAASPTLSAHVRVIGPMADVLPYIVASDTLVLPSAMEGVPLVMIEAVLAERPIVASRVSGLDAYLPDALLFPPDDPDAFVQRIFSSRDVDMSRLAADFRRRFSREAFDAQAQRTMMLSAASRDGYNAASTSRSDVFEK